MGEMSGRVTKLGAAASLLAISSLAAGGEPVSAYGPPDFGYAWVCLGGDWSASWQGLCFTNQPGADAVWHFSGSGWTTTRNNAVRTGQSRWDQTNGHQFNFVEDAYPGDGYSGFPVYWRTTQICGLDNAIGCTTTVGAGGGQFEVTRMEFRNPPNLTHTAAHEFGHAVGLGHGGGASSVMRSSTATVLSSDDTEARCHIYGHSMGLWGGCPCPK